MVDLRTLIAEALRATVIHTSTRFSWFGTQSPPLSQFTKRALTPATAHNYLQYAIQMILYTNFYCRGRAIHGRVEGESAIAATIPFVERLSAANCGIGSWDGGWLILSIADNLIVVSRNGLQLGICEEDCLVSKGQMTPGGQVRLLFPKELLSLSPGYYVALGNCEFSQDDQQSIVRLYWNLAATGAIDFVRYLTTKLNGTELPFKLKVLNDPMRYTRCDSGVLYIPKRYYMDIRELIESVYYQLETNLKPGVPAFTKCLAPGLGLAEDPGQGDSFGMHRCRLLAEAMINSQERGITSFNHRMLAVEENFEKNGISLEKPFLKAGSHDEYELCTQFIYRSQISNSEQQQSDHLQSEGFLQTAEEIGRRLVEEAFWAEDRCNWLGGVLEGHQALGTLANNVYGSLGPDLYSGTSGIALFLAELHAVTSDNKLRRTAFGAMQQALTQLDTVPTLERLGLYRGWMGIAFAAVRVGNLIGAPDLLQRAQKLANESTRQTLSKHEFNVISGSSGAILVLIILARILGDSSLLKVAEQLGDNLLQSADKTENGYSWISRTSHYKYNLTGYSHGTAGIAHALLELFGITSDPRYLKGAEMAFRYEQRLFDIDMVNWPDFRTVANKRLLKFSTNWAHGAPGIALSRLRAFELLQDEAFITEATIALETTRKSIEIELNSGLGDFSLANGLTGNAEVLLYGSQVLGERFIDRSITALDVANAGIKSYGEHKASWPCGTVGGESPGLMLGLAGIGLFYLHLHDPKIPSILLLTQQFF